MESVHKIEMLPVSDLNPYSRNAKKHQAADVAVIDEPRPARSD